VLIFAENKSRTRKKRILKHTFRAHYGALEESGSGYFSKVQNNMPDR